MEKIPLPNSVDKFKEWLKCTSRSEDYRHQFPLQHQQQIIYKHHHVAYETTFMVKKWYGIGSRSSHVAVCQILYKMHTPWQQVSWRSVTKPLPRYYALQPKEYSGWIYFCHRIIEHQQLVKHILFYNQVQFMHNGKTNIQNSISACCFIWVWTFVLHMLGCTQAGGCSEQNSEADILGKAEGSNRRQEKEIPRLIPLGWPNQGQWDGQGMNK